MKAKTAENKYSVWPCVIPVGIPTEMTITPKGMANMLPEGKEYELVLIPMNEDEPDSDAPVCQAEVTVAAHGGVLRFTYLFSGEQEYLIHIKEEGKPTRELSVYALHSDLYALRPMKGELHSHSRRSDGGLDPAVLHGRYREHGYEFHALTDHHRYHPGREIDAVYKGVKLGITHVQGEEVHAPGNEMHIVNAGGKASVAALYITDREGYDRAVEQYMTRVPAHIPERYRYRYASCHWVCDRIHEAGGLAVLAHPYWHPPNRTYQCCDELTRILLCSGMFDAFEVVCSMGPAEVNRIATVWNELRAEEGLRIPVVGSSDLHSFDSAKPTSRQRIGNFFTLCFVEEASEEGVCSAIRDFRSVAVEGTGEAWGREYRCYGKLRLISYAQFLLRHYYPQLQRICQGEGVAMCNYAMGDGSKELIRLLVEQSEQFRLRFFGQLPPPVPSDEVLAMEAEWGGITVKKWTPTLLGEKERLYPLK